MPKWKPMVGNLFYRDICTNGWYCPPRPSIHSRNRVSNCWNVWRTVPISRLWNAQPWYGGCYVLHCFVHGRVLWIRNSLDWSGGATIWCIFSQEKDDYSAVIWPVTGRFKNAKGGWYHYMIPIAGVTRSSVQVFEWTQRVIKRLVLVGQVDGWLFWADNGVDRAFASDYAENIYNKLETLQRTTELIDSGCDVREEYGIQRSGRRFFNTQCINMGVSSTDIEFQCRWRSDRAKGGRTVKQSMLHTYPEVRIMKTALLFVNWSTSHSGAREISRYVVNKKWWRVLHVSMPSLVLRHLVNM